MLPGGVHPVGRQLKPLWSISLFLSSQRCASQYDLHMSTPTSHKKHIILPRDARVAAPASRG